MDVHITLILLMMLARCTKSTFLENNSLGMCPSPQYLRMGSTSTVQCWFHLDFHAVLWYNTTNYPEEDPIVRYQNMMKLGRGLNSGEFDIHPNGSLIINHVSLSHDHTFKVGYVHYDSELPTLIDVQVVVTVHPQVHFPVLENCGNSSNKCYSVIKSPFLRCSVRGSRPAVFLDFTLRTVTGDIDISNESLTIQEGFEFSSHVTTKNIFSYSSRLALLVCKASIPPGILLEHESMTLVQRSSIDFKSWKPKRIHVIRYDVMELKCTETQIGFLLWKKVSPREEQEILLYTVLIPREFTEIFASDFSLGIDGSLKTSVSDLRHEGSYVCLFGDGETDGVTVYEVSILVYPVPAYPVIDGCSHEKCCVLKADRQGNFTCSVTGIRPKVQLEWGELSQAAKSGTTIITFKNQKLIVVDNGETFDLTLKTVYNIQESKSERVTIECRIVSDVFQASSQVDLVLVEDVSPTHITHTGRYNPSRINFILLHVIITILSAILLIILVLALVIAIASYAGKKQRTRKRESPGTGDEQEAETFSLGSDPT